MRHWIIALGLLLSLSGCASHDPLNPAPPKLPYKAWYVGAWAPDYMEVWIETVDVIDRRGLVYERVHGGVASIHRPPNNQGNPRGWPERPGGGAGRRMTGIDLPEFIFVRWQSLVEPQTYNVRIDIPEWVREEMLTPHEAYCRYDGQTIVGYRENIGIGLAPGGIAKAWVLGPCLEPIEIGRFVGKINPRGPYGATSEGRHRPLTEISREYIETHGIPYDSW